ncbi:gp604 [Bacillus phage G]|uniref:Gp604 n=1 Tax=Bacillus phage G TaxID=2884420 RepID=G3MAY4_9CAUD|nr:gp604 [Bacillus phage G]AEO93849.1 gp604 [Bacillus phage G]
MSQLTEEQIEEVVEAIFDMVPEDLCGMGYFGEAIKHNGLEHLFTEEQMNTFHECQIVYGPLGSDEEEEENEDEDDDGEDNGCDYEVRHSYPWMSGSWYDYEESLDERIKEEITTVVKVVIKNVK